MSSGLQRTLGLVLVLVWVGSVNAQIPFFGGDGSGAGGPRLGIEARALSPEALKRHDLEYGVGVAGVEPGGPAEAAGLQQGDILVSLEGRPVYSVERLRFLIGETFKPDQTLELSYLRDGKRETTTITPALAQSGPALPPAPYQPRSYLGVGLQALTPGLRQHFDVPAERGVLVTRVASNTPAAEVGLQAGDVLLALQGKAIRGVDDVVRALAFFEPEDTVTLTWARDKQKQQAEVTLAAPPEGQDYPPSQPGQPPLPDGSQSEWQQEFDQFLQRWRDRMQDLPQRLPEWVKPGDPAPTDPPPLL